MKRIFLYGILPLALLAACTQTLREEVTEAPAAPAAQLEADSPLIPGEMYLELSEELADQLAGGLVQTKSAAINSAFEGLGVVRIERLYPDAGEWEPRHRKAGLHRWFHVVYDPAAQPATKAAVDFSSIDGVLYAEPVRRIRSTSYFNDPRAGEQWALSNDGSLPNSKAGCDVNVVPVWDNYTAGSSDVIVGVIDSGIQMDHPDLAAITIPGGQNGSRSFVNGYSGYTIYPDNHGTHVAGIIAAVNNNGEGISGIAGGRDGRGGVRILACPFLHVDPNDPDKTIQGNSENALVWAADHGAVIAQNSWGNVYDSKEEAHEGGPGACKAAIDYFIQYAGCDKDGNQLPDSPMKGGVVIFAAGNESWDIGWPAAYEPVIAVGAVSAQYTRSYYSNYGDWVDICAPGGDAKQNRRILSTVMNDQYAEMQGTSMACPMVSGVAALIVSHFGGPGFTNKMLEELLLGGARKDAVPTAYEIGPLVDAMGSFSMQGTSEPFAPDDVTATAASNNITLDWTVTSDPDDGKAYGYVVVVSEDPEELADLNPRRLPASVKQVVVEVGTRAVGESISATLSGLDFWKEYYAGVFAYDYSRNYAVISNVVAVSTLGNNPPQISTDYDGDFVVQPFGRLSLTYKVVEPDGHGFTVDVNPASEAFTYSVANGEIFVTIYGNRAPHGVYTAHIVATDAYGAKTDLPVRYEILENHAPKVVAEIGDLLFSTVGASQTFDLTKYIQDEDGEPLTYTVTLSEQNVAHLNPNGSSLVLTTLGYGMTTATITATDACKASCSLIVRVLVRDTSRPADLYPNPVVNTLNIRPGQEGQLEVSITNRIGATVWSGSAAAGPFSPMSVDLSGQPGGLYYVRIDGAGINQVFTIAKQ